MKKYLALLFCLALFALPARAQDLSASESNAVIAKAANYLNAITTLKARFTQTNMDGAVLSGTFYLKRPGRLRFEYDPPNGDYIVADGLFVHYWDDGAKNYSNATIGSTLADFLLRKHIRLTGDVKVTSVRRPAENKILLTLVQSDNPNGGDLRMLFTETPMRLEKWRVTDGAGQITEVALTDLQTAVNLPATLFVFKPPKGYDKDWQNTR